MIAPGSLLVRRVLRFGYRNSRSISFSSSHFTPNLINYISSYQRQNLTNLFHTLKITRARHTKVMGALGPFDPTSYSRPDIAILKHMSLALNVDFEAKVLSGSALLHFDVLKETSELILDSRDLTIESMELENGSPLEYKEDGNTPNFGSKLVVTLPHAVQPNESVKVKVSYKTAPTASGLQWLDPEQTSGKQHPYLFSQCEPIHARSIVPCQDSPAVKFTYEASVTAPEPFTVLMSAIRGDVKGNRFTFKQPMPLPSYLIAIAVGVLESRQLGPRSKVWAEKELVDRSAWEFALTEQYLEAAEKLCGKYQWTQYDLLVLPPSFPYGGMENPCLTFVTPTLLAGDRSQATVIVHEIMHSWTGNLVTTKTFEHFWLNEGFTVYLERKVAASLVTDPIQAKKSRDFESILGLQELRETVVDTLGVDSPLTQLVIKLDDVHPDDAFSRVPYEKGSLFLRYLEDLFGGPVIFDDFLRSYLNNFQKKSLDTNEFKAYLFDYFKGNENLNKVDWDTWFYKPGMPVVIPNYDKTMTESVDSLIKDIEQGNATFTHDEISSFQVNQLILLLQHLIDTKALPIDKLKAIGSGYKIQDSHNTEIQYRWFRMCIRSRDHDRLADVFNFINSQGRMKYVRPIYRDLYAWEDVRQQTLQNFLENEKYMMHVSAYTIRKDLHLDAETD